MKGTVIAGKGSSTALRERFRLERNYHIPEDKWKKVSGKGYIIVNGKRRYAKIH